MIKTPVHRAKNAIRFKEHDADSCYLVLAKSTAWDDDLHPPTIPPSTLSLSDQFCAYKATVSWIKKDAGGVISVIDKNGDPQNYSELITRADVITEAANAITKGMLVLLRATVHFNDLSVQTFRKIAFVTDLVPSVGFEEEPFLTAGQVDNWGNLETLEYLLPIPVIPNSQIRFSNILTY